ncbi:MAG: hypothetical protein QOG15_1592 [Solirubrobacteraceae bacterium]|nr:hypothetical protein [Solirubrobacteraceae bacterium]
MVDVSAATRNCLGWALIAGGTGFGADVLLANHYAVGGPAGFGLRAVLLLGVALALIAAGAFEVRRTWSHRASEADVVRVARMAAPGLVAFAVYLCAFIAFSPVETGDQGFYELEAFSLAYDHDRDLANDVVDPTRVRPVAPFGFSGLQAHRYTRHGTGPLISIHHVGLPLLLAPAVPLVWAAQRANPRMRLWPWHVEMIVFGALAAQLLFLILARVSPARRSLRTAVWATVVFSPPVLVFSIQVFPEMPAALLALLAVYALLREPSRAWLLVASLAVAAMPWLHVRYVLIAAPLALVITYRAITVLPDVRRDRAAMLRAAALAAGPLVLSIAVMAIAFQHWYGSPLLDAQNGGTASFRLEASYRYLGGLWSSTRGWLPYAPVSILALAGIPLLRRRFGGWGVAGFVIGLVYLALVAWEARDPGYSFPGRYEVILMPFASIPLLVLVEQVRWTRPLFAVLGIATFALTVAMIIQPMPAIMGSPGRINPVIPYSLWDWFVGLWPAVSFDPRVPSYPDAGAVAVWTGALAVLAAAAYATVRRART